MEPRLPECPKSVSAFFAHCQERFSNSSILKKISTVALYAIGITAAALSAISAAAATLPLIVVTIISTAALIPCAIFGAASALSFTVALVSFSTAENLSRELAPKTAPEKELPIPALTQQELTPPPLVLS